MEQSKRSVSRGSFYIVVQGAVTYLVLFLSYVVLTRILSRSEIGELPLLTAAYTVFSTVTLFSLGTATTKYVAQYAGTKNENKVAGVGSTALKTVAALSVPSFLVVALISPQLTKLIFGTAMDPAVLVLVILAAVILNLGTILVAMLWGMNLFAQMVIANIVGVVTSRVIGVLLAASHLRLEGYFIGWIIGNGSTILIALFFVGPHLRKTQVKIPAAAMLVYSYPIMLSTVIGLVQQWADVTILYGLTRSFIYTGAYYLGLAGAGILSPIANAISNAVFPSLSSMHGRDDDESFRKVLRITVRAFNVLVIPASLGLAAIAPIAVRVAYGAAYFAATIPFAILIISGIFTAYQTLMTTVLQSIAKTQPLLKVAAVAAVVEIILTAVTVASLNVVGAAVARFGMVLVSLLLTYWYVKGKWWPSLDSQQLMKCLALSFLVAAVLFGFDSYLGSRFVVYSLSRLVVDIGLFFITYLTGLIVLKPLHQEDIDLLKAAVPSALHRPLRTLERRTVPRRSVLS